MKIKKSELEKIILEETLNLLSEARPNIAHAARLKRVLLPTIDSLFTPYIATIQDFKVLRSLVLQKDKLYHEILKTADANMPAAGKGRRQPLPKEDFVDAFNKIMQDIIDKQIDNTKGKTRESLEKFQSGVVFDPDPLLSFKKDILKNPNLYAAYVSFENSGRQTGASAPAAPAVGAGPMTPAQLQQLQDPYGINKTAAKFGVPQPGSGPMTPAQLQQLQDPYGIDKMAAGFGVPKPGSGKKGMSKTAKQKSLLRRADAFGGSLQNLQKTLGLSGYFGSRDIAAGKDTFSKGLTNPDGKYGEETEEAIKYLQKTLGVKQDGWYGKNTHKAWKASGWKKSPEEEAASRKARLANPKRPAGRGLVSVLGRAIADAEKEN